MFTPSRYVRPEGNELLALKISLHYHAVQLAKIKQEITKLEKGLGGEPILFTPGAPAVPVTRYTTKLKKSIKEKTNLLNKHQEAYDEVMERLRPAFT